MEKILDHYGNEIHIGDYVVPIFSDMSHFSNFGYVHKVVGLKYDDMSYWHDMVVDCNYPADKRGTTTELCARDCLVTTLHNYIQSQKSILRRIRDERRRPVNENRSYRHNIRELCGICDTADWQRPYIPQYYYDKTVGGWILNHPQTRRRKARKTNRFVMTNTKIPPKPTFL